MLSPSLAVCNTVQLNCKKCACQPSKSFMLVVSFMIHLSYMYLSQAQPLTVSIKGAFNGRKRKGVNLEFCISKVKWAGAPAAFTGMKIKRVTIINYSCDSCSLISMLCRQISKVSKQTCNLKLWKGLQTLAGYAHI